MAPNYHAKNSSRQTAGNLKIWNYTFWNAVTLYARSIWPFAVCPNVVSPLSVSNSMLTKIQSMTCMRLPSSNMFKTFQTRSVDHRHIVCHRRKHTPLPAHCWAVALLSHGNSMLMLALRWTYKSVPTTSLGRVKSTNISSVGSRTRAWRRTRTTCWRKNTPLCDSQAWKMAVVSRSSWIVSQMIRLGWSGNYTLSTIWDGMPITNALSITGVEKSSKAWDTWCSRQPMLSISFMTLSVAFMALRHLMASIPKCTLRTCGWRLR